MGSLKSEKQPITENLAEVQLAGLGLGANLQLEPATRSLATSTFPIDAENANDRSQPVYDIRNTAQGLFRQAAFTGVNSDINDVANAIIRIDSQFSSVEKVKEQLNDLFVGLLSENKSFCLYTAKNLEKFLGQKLDFSGIDQQELLNKCLGNLSQGFGCVVTFSSESPQYLKERLTEWIPSERIQQLYCEWVGKDGLENITNFKEVCQIMGEKLSPDTVQKLRDNYLLTELSNLVDIGAQGDVFFSKDMASSRLRFLYENCEDAASVAKIDPDTYKEIETKLKDDVSWLSKSDRRDAQYVMMSVAAPYRVTLFDTVLGGIKKFLN